jgi:hypothetical protein
VPKCIEGSVCGVCNGLIGASGRRPQAVGVSGRDKEVARGSIAGGEKSWPQIGRIAWANGVSVNGCEAGSNWEGLPAVMDDGRHGSPAKWLIVRTTAAMRQHPDHVDRGTPWGPTPESSRHI